MTTGVRWLSVPPGSGFGNASAAYMSGLRRAGVPVSWSPLTWPSTPWDSPFGRAGADDGLDLSNTEHAGIVDLEICHDSVVVCGSPFWHDRLRHEAGGRRLVAYSAWETDRLRPSQIEVLSRYDLVLVPSRFNAEVFARSGLPVPVVAVPHCVDDDPSPPGRDPAGSERFVFYTVAPWTVRKAIADIVTAFATAFSDTDPVELVIYTGRHDLIAGEALDRGVRPWAPHADMSWMALATTLAGRRHAPAIRLNTRPRSNREVAALHRAGHCFVGLSRGEGWGLGAFEAGAAGNPVVITGWGGWLEFLPAGYPFRAEFDLVPTLSDPPDRWWSPAPGERWAKVRIEHAAELLRRVFEHREEARWWGRQLRRHILEGYSMSGVTRQLAHALDAHGLRTAADRAPRSD